MNDNLKRRGRRLRALIPIAVASTLLAACGSTGSTTASGDSTAASNPELQQKLDALYKGTYSTPEEGTPKPEAGKSIWVIATDLSQAWSATFAKSAEAAGKTLGWNVHVFDAKQDPNNALQGVRSAVADHADGIIDQVFDCNQIKAGLAEAKAAGIKLIGQQATDCDTPMFDASVVYEPGLYDSNDGTTAGFLESAFKPQMDWLAAKNPNAHVITVNETDSNAAVIQAKGAKDELTASCPGCKIVDSIDIVYTDYPSLQQKVQQALLQHPDADAVVNTIADGIQLIGISAAIQAAGRPILATGSEGAAPNLDLMRKGGPEDVANCQLPAWDAYTDMDQLIRVFGGVKPATHSGNGYLLIDKDHNLPASGGCVAMKDGKPFDFVGAYKTLWGM